MSGYTKHIIEMTPLKQKTQTSYPDLLQTMRKVYGDGRTKSVQFRREQLKGLQRLLLENEEELATALKNDLHKHIQEVVTFEIQPVLNDIKLFLRHLSSYLKEQKVCKAPINWFNGLYLYKDPYGVVLIMGAWNYPVLSVLLPFAGALAAGNCVILKPSHSISNSASALSKLIPKYLDPECYTVVLGGVDETGVLLRERFDLIFCTASQDVGRIVHKAANKHLTPTVLVMGGKNPVYLDSSVDLTLAVKRILWGKCVNSGQTCIAPDYVLCTPEIQTAFVEEAQKVIESFYGREIDKSESYGRIISDRQFGRLMKLLKSGRIAVGGGSDPKERFIEPTILTDVSPNDAIMQEEIFGPILPIVLVQDVEEAVKFINGREKPLVLYVFSKKKQVVKQLLKGTSSGAFTINDTIMQGSVFRLPFGGVGASGMGAYHGNWSINTFTHTKSVLSTPLNNAMEKLYGIRYPPYTTRKIQLIKATSALTRRLPCNYFPHICIFILGIIIGFVIALAI